MGRDWTLTKVEALIKLRDRLKNEYKSFDSTKITIGDFTYGKPIVHSWGDDAKLIIGKFCSIGNNVWMLLGGNHHNEWLTTYPFNALLPEIWGNIDGGIAATKGNIIIGNDVWIANDVTIMSGVTIGDGATIANGARVVKDVAPYSVVGGIPAKHLKWRDKATIIKNLKWWDWPLEKIAEAVPLLQSQNFNLLIEFDKKWEGI